jgi:hypothetical protein
MPLEVGNRVELSVSPTDLHEADFGVPLWEKCVRLADPRSRLLIVREGYPGGIFAFRVQCAVLGGRRFYVWIRPRMLKSFSVRCIWETKET